MQTKHELTVGDYVSVPDCSNLAQIISVGKDGRPIVATLTTVGTRPYSADALKFLGRLADPQIPAKKSKIERIRDIIVEDE